jgi:O-antigen ligase
MTSFAYPFAVFFQPGVFWPQLADFRPLQIIAFLALLMSIGSKTEFERMDAVRHPTARWFFAFLFIQMLSVYRTGIALMLQEFMFWSIYALFFFVSLRVIHDTASLRRYVWGMIWGSMWVIGYGIYAVHAGLNTANGGRAGAYGMYENHNDFSFLIVQVLPFLYLYWHAEKGVLRRLFLAASLIACVVGIFLSLSRGGMLALVLEIMLLVIYTMTPRWRLVLLPLVLAVGAAAVAYQYAKRAENQGAGYTAEDAETSRFELWNAGAAMIKAHPLVGVGSRTFGEHSKEYAEISHDNLGKNAHNTFVDIAATSGLLGIAAFVLMLRAAIRELRTPVGDSTSHSPWIDVTRRAALIALYTLCFRAMFDAKTWDWSFYLLVTIAAVTGAMVQSRKSTDLPDAQPAPPDAQGRITNRLPART